VFAVAGAVLLAVTYVRRAPDQASA
jgi:hypothetical protein